MLDSLLVTDRQALAIGVILYLTAFGFGLGALLLRKSYSRPILYALLGGGFLLQTLGLNLRGMEIQACPLGNPFEIAQFITWSFVLLFFIVGPLFHLRLLGFFTAGLAALVAGISFFVPGWDHDYPSALFGGNPWIELHAALAIFSYGVFAIVALVALMFIIQQHGLKHKRFKGVYEFLPSIQQLDLMAKRLMTTGVIMLSAALAVGAVFWVQHPDAVPPVKLTVTLIVWAGYLAVVLLRQRRQLITRRYAVSAILLFFLAVGALWPVQNSRAAPQPEAPESTTPAPASAASGFIPWSTSGLSSL